MVKLEVIDNFAKSAIDGDLVDITAELILALVHIFMTLESHVPGTGHKMLKAVHTAIVTNTIADVAAQTAAEAQ